MKPLNHQTTCIHLSFTFFKKIRCVQIADAGNPRIRRFAYNNIIHTRSNFEKCKRIFDEQICAWITQWTMIYFIKKRRCLNDLREISTQSTRFT